MEKILYLCDDDGGSREKKRMGKKIVVSFPGGRGYEIPLLYFGAKFYKDKDYDKLFISHLGYGDYDFQTLLENAEKVIQKVKINLHNK